MEDAPLDRALRAAHARRDARQLCRLHRDAAHRMAAPAEARFHLTQAWVYALDAGDEGTADALAHRLRALGGL